MNKKLVSIFLSATLIFQVGAMIQVSAIGDSGIIQSKNSTRLKPKIMRTLKYVAGTALTAAGLYRMYNYLKPKSDFDEVSCMVNNNYKLENIDKALLEAACGGFWIINENTATLQDLDRRSYALGYINLLYKFRDGLITYFYNGKLKEISKKKLFEQMEKSCKKFKTTFDISTPKKEKFTIKLLECRAKELLKLINKYQEETKQREKDTEAYFSKASAALEKHKGVIKKPFQEVARSYGSNANGWGYCQYNEFLRRHGHDLLDPKGYALGVSKVADLTKGIVENNFLADKDITLYRYTRFDALANQLVSCKCLDKSKATELLENMLPDYSELAKTLSEKKPTISDPAFLSTSKSPTATAGFGNIKLEIKVKKGTAIGADITRFSGHPEQQEVLLVPNQKLKVIKAEGDDYGRMSITVETVK